MVFDSFLNIATEGIFTYNKINYYNLVDLILINLYIIFMFYTFMYFY